MKIVIYQVMRPLKFYPNFIAATGKFCFKTAALASCSVNDVMPYGSARFDLKSLRFLR